MNLPELDPEDHSVVAGRRFGYATVGEWVALCPALTDRDVRIYNLLRAHCASGKDLAWPTQPTLALMLGVKKTDGVSESIQRLRDVGAIDVTAHRTPTGRRNVYTVHETPPDGYSLGPLDNADFYRQRETNRRSGGVTP